MEELRHSIRIDGGKCRGTMKCLRVCPTEAIRVRGCSAFMLEDRCIDCGECLRVCPQNAIVPLTNSFVDFSRFKHTIAIPSPVIYTQFGKKVTPGLLLEALLEVGFDSYYDVSIPCEETALAIEQFLSEYEGPYPLITPFCPTVVRILQVKFPELADLLLPIESPMEIAAREAKDRAAKRTGLDINEIGAIYLTPCPVKMLAIQQHPRKKESYLDGAIAISDIYGPVRSALQKISRGQVKGEEVTQVSGLGVGWSRLDGLTRCLTSETLVVSGFDYVIKIFEEIENRQLRDITLLECHTCRIGCVGGSLNVENPYVARHRLRELQAALTRKPVMDKSLVLQRSRKGYYSLDQKLPTYPIKPLADDLSQAIEKVKQREELLAGLPGIDCGVCGAPSCKAFAEDVITERADKTDCFFVQRRKLGELLRKSIRYLDSTGGQAGGRK